MSGRFHCAGSGAGVLTGFALLSLVALTPVLICALPPILDYPNHMARMHILAATPLSGSLARFYTVAWSPIPDLAEDAVVPLLARIMPVEIAMRVGLAAILLGLASGAVVLHRATFGRWSVWPLTAFLLLYNRMLLWGFLNYLLGVALLLWALAAWVALEQGKPLVRLAAGMAMATVIYLAHLAAFGCYALAVIALALTPPAREGAKASVGAARRFMLAAATLAPPVVLFLLSPTSDAPAKIAYGNPLRKLDLPVSIFDNYDRVLDGATFAVLLLAVIVGLARGAICLHKRLGWCLAAVLAAFILLPSQLLTASGIDHRLPVVIALLFVAASELRLRHSATAAMLVAALTVLFLARTTIVLNIWDEAGRQYTALLPAIDAIAPGAALAVAAPASGANAGGVPLLHFPALAVIARDAFVPSLFADPHQQPVGFTPEARRLAAEAPPNRVWDLLSRNAPVSLAGYDDLMIVDPPPSLHHDEVPGVLMFEAPRLWVVRLTPSPAENPR